MIETHQAPSTDLLRDIVRRACEKIDDRDLRFGLREFAKWYAWTVRSNKAMYDHYRRMLDRLALKEEHIRELIIRDATPQERKRMLRPDKPYEYTAAGRAGRGQ